MSPGILLHVDDHCDCQMESMLMMIFVFPKTAKFISNSVSVFHDVILAHSRLQCPNIDVDLHTNVLSHHEYVHHCSRFLQFMKHSGISGPISC